MGSDKPGEIVDFYEEKDKILNKLTLIKPDGPQPPFGSNWLMDLPIGTLFTAKSKDRGNFMLLNLEILRKTPKSVRLWEFLSGKPLGDVEPSRFCGMFELNEIIPQEEERKEDEQPVEGDETPTS